MLTNCLDISNYSGTITASNVAQWKANGIELVIVGLQYPTTFGQSLGYPEGVAHQQIGMLIAGGIRVEVYAESFALADVWWRVSAYQPFIERVWVAAEEDHVNEAWLDQELAFADSLNLIQRAGIYTGTWWWDWQPFRLKYVNRPLWLADYDGILTPMDYWPNVTVWQHAGSSNFGNVDMVDLNEYFFSTTDSLETETTLPTQAEFDALVERVASLEYVLYKDWTGDDANRVVDLLGVGGVVEAVHNLTTTEAPSQVARSSVQFVSVNTDPASIMATGNLIKTWLETKHNRTFDILPSITITSNTDYEAIRSALLLAGVDLSIPTFAYAPGPVGPGSFGDPEQLAVKEVVDPVIVAHELAHIWTQTGNEAHDVPNPPDDDSNSFNYNPYSILGMSAQGGMPLDKAVLVDVHLTMADQQGYIRPL